MPNVELRCLPLRRKRGCILSRIYHSSASFVTPSSNGTHKSLFDDGRDCQIDSRSLLCVAQAGIHLHTEFKTPHSFLLQAIFFSHRSRMRSVRKRTQVCESHVNTSGRAIRAMSLWWNSSVIRLETNQRKDFVGLLDWTRPRRAHSYLTAHLTDVDDLCRVLL